MEKSLFSKIIDGEIPSYKIYEDDKVYAFLDINPAAKGHTLVVPKVFTESVLTADEDTAAYTFKITTKLAQHIAKVLHADGVNILTNAGSAAGQVVMHWHVHIIPRFDNDAIGDFHFTHTIDTDETPNFFEIIQKKIQTNLI